MCMVCTDIRCTTPFHMQHTVKPHVAVIQHLSLCLTNHAAVHQLLHVWMGRAGTGLQGWELYGGQGGGLNDFAWVGSAMYVHCLVLLIDPIVLQGCCAEIDIVLFVCSIIAWSSIVALRLACCHPGG